MRSFMYNNFTRMQLMKMKSVSKQTSEGFPFRDSLSWAKLLVAPAQDIKETLDEVVTVRPERSAHMVTFFYE